MPIDPLNQPAPDPDGEVTNDLSAAEVRRLIAKSVVASALEQKDTNAKLDAVLAGQARLEAAQAQPGPLVAFLTSPLLPLKSGHVVAAVGLVILAVWAIGGELVKELLSMVPWANPPQPAP